jgi:hypothetical protein
VLKVFCELLKRCYTEEENEAALSVSPFLPLAMMEKPEIKPM